MTISEWLMGNHIRQVSASPGVEPPTPELVCANRTRLRVVAGKFTELCYPVSDVGPWTMFSVAWAGGPSPGNLFSETHRAISVPAGDLVRLLERLGWPEAQLGKRWKKRGAAARK